MTTTPFTATEDKDLTVFQRVVNAWSHVMSAMNAVGTLWIFALMFLICGDVIGLAFFNHPIRGVAEIAAYSLAGATFLQLAHTLHSGRFTRAEMLIGNLDKNYPIPAGVFHLAFSVGGVLVFWLIADGTYYKFLEAWPSLKFGAQGEFTILVWPLRAIILFGAIVCGIEYFFQAIANSYRLVEAVRARLATPTQQQQPLGWIYIAVLAAVCVMFAGVFQGGFTKFEIGLMSFAGMLILIYLGMHVGIALVLLGFGGIYLMMPTPVIALNVVKLSANEYLRNYFFSTVPLFVLMGLLVNESDIGKDTFNVARWALRWLKGGLGVATVAANAIFSAITGSSLASAAVFTKVATPHLIDQGYTPKFSVGVVAGSSVLGVLIPPSLLLIIYGFVAETSIGLLFLAAVVPGIMLATAMALGIVAMAYLWPSFVGTPKGDDDLTENVVSAAVKLFPIVLLIFLVMGGIYGGFFTPVEAGAVGAAGALIISTAKRRLTWRKLWKVLVETGHITVSVLFLVLGANIYSSMLALSNLPQHIGEFIVAAEFSYFGFMAIYILVLIVLGMFLDSISIMLVILPLVLPILPGLGIDLIAFGIITVVGLEMGLLTPPMGLCCYVVRSSLDDDRVSLNAIFAGSFPFVIIMAVMITILTIYPGLAKLFV